MTRILRPHGHMTAGEQQCRRRQCESVALQLQLPSESASSPQMKGSLIQQHAVTDGRVNEETTSAWPWLTETHVNTLLSVPSSSSPSSVSCYSQCSAPFLSRLLQLLHLLLSPWHLCPIQLYLQTHLPPPPCLPSYVSKAVFLSDADS